MDDEMELLGAMYDDELAGYDDDEGDVGAFNFRRAFRSRGGRGYARAVSRRKAAYINKLIPRVPGTPTPGARNFPVGFGTFAFVNGGATAVNLIANPQRPIKGARLVVQVNRTGATATGLVTITTLLVGQNNQLVSAQALPAEAFAPGAFQTTLSLDPATPGIDITLGLSISAAPGAGDQVDVSAMLIGDAIG